MKNFRLSRNLWLIAGFGFLLTFILNLSNNESLSLLTLSGY